MTDTNTPNTSSASGASSGAGTSAPVAPQAQPQVTVEELFQVTKFLENLAQMGRLSQLEVEGIKPAFEKIVSFLRYYEAQMVAAQAAQNASAVTEVSSEEIDTATVKSKKKAGKKK